MPSINLIICFGDDTLYAAAAAELDEECEAEREECEADEVDNETRVEREGEPRRDDELDLGEAEADDEDREACEADDEDREADDDIELLAAGDILLYCSGVPEEGLPFAILRLTIACNIRACAFSIP